MDLHDDAVLIDHDGPSQSKVAGGKADARSRKDSPIWKSASRRFALLALAAVAVLSPGQSPTELERGFRQPPASARPRTLWMWMNGNVTADGITRDLEAMRRAGLGGALIFNIGEYIPKGPVDYGGQAWLQLMAHAAREADRLGLEIGMHNCPGWSSSGGPWITPEMAMQQLVWSETKIAGPRRAMLDLPQPYTKLNHYRDVCVLAFPSLAGEERPFADRLSRITIGQGASVDKALLTDGNLATGVHVDPQNPLVLQFAEPFEARAITVFPNAGGSTVSFALECGDDGVTFRNVASLTPPGPRAIEEAPLVESFGPVRARFFRLTPVRPRDVTEVELHSASRIAGWSYRADFSHRAARQEALPAEPAKEFVIDPASVRDLTGLTDRQGRLTWEVPPGAWTILRFGHTASGRQNIAAPDTGVGLECDKLSPAGVEFHFKHGLGKLMETLGPLAGKSFNGLEVDSYEVGMQNWTTAFPEEFRARNGYELRCYLPAMTGRFVGSADVSERFLWDIRRTHAQMVADYYYGRLRELCRQYGLKLYVEPYGAGPGPYDELQIAARADTPMGEFWAHFPWDDTPSLRLAASAAHVYGQSAVAGESFTAAEEQSRYLDYPYALKTIGDFAFSLGLNQMFFHRYAHQPHPTAVPGMTMGPWGFHFDRNVTWFEQSSSWLDYLARCQSVLQPGQFVADVLYFTGEGSPQVSKRAVPELPPGYNFDAASADVLLSPVRVENGRIVLPDGMSYRLLALPADLKNMTPELLRRLQDLVAEGATLVGPKPSFSPSLRGYPESDDEIRRLGAELWGKANAAGRAAGRGTVFAAQPLLDVLSRLGLKPDFEYSSRQPDASLVWLHRRVGDADVYFVANRQRRSEDVVCTFRVAGKRPEFWQPETGQVRSAAVYRIEDGRTHVPLHLDPAESVFVVFRDPADAKPVRWVAKDGVRVTEAEPFPRPMTDRASAITNSFTIAAWVKPDTDMMFMPAESPQGQIQEMGRSYVVTAPEGELLYGPGHAAMGVAAGRNGVIVVERSSDRAWAVLVSTTPLSGWTHLALVYRDGKPSLYQNGEFIREGLASGRVIHPGIGAPPPPRRIVYYFDGDMTQPELFAEPLTAERIAGLAAKGLPKPDDPQSVELSRRADGDVEALVWQAGTYSLDDGHSLAAPDILPPTELRGPWQVAFPPSSGAPARLSLPELVSLHKYSDPAVRYFSGVATYTHAFETPAGFLSQDKRVFLDLGRVQVSAEVRVNGRNLGILWKPPYRVDVTDAVRAGRNRLEIRVANLWSNRLIGDETLPPENEYNPSNRAIERLPEWFAKGQPKPPGGRTTFVTWHFYTKEEPLLESGLLGPVRLRTAARRVFNR
jgi:hypothetical protein